MQEVLQTPQYQTLMLEHITKTLDFLFTQKQPFAIVCAKKFVLFNPHLPGNIYENFSEQVLFILKNHSFESASFDAEVLQFEAGFGEENFGSTVRIPLLAIGQIYIGETPILLNLSEYMPKVNQEKKSLEALLKNPSNKALFKNKKT